MADITENSSSASPSAASSLNADTPFDPAYYTWSLFFRGIMGTASDSDVKRYIHNRSLVKEASDCAQCESWRDWLLEYSPTVTFMRSSIEKVGGEIHKGTIQCRRCDTLAASGISQGQYKQGHGIVLCANHVRSKGVMEDVLAHEMVHQYDWQRFGFDKWNLRHSACTEIRANLLSGECRWTREFFGKRQFRFTQHFQECVRRRATLSVRMHPACKDEEHANRVVNDVWDSCFNDTRPFDEIYR